MQTKINNEIREILKTFGDEYIIEGVLNKGKLIRDLDNKKPKLLEALLSNNIINKTFTDNINGHNVIDIRNIISSFELDQFWLDSYTKYTNKIGLSSNNNFLNEGNDVVLSFPYKDTVLKASMSKEDTDENDLKPNEPFLNEIIAKEEIDILLDTKILKNIKIHDENGKKNKLKYDNENLIIKGNNLIALHSIKDKFRGKVKMIFIDPPYNTGRDSFKYNDKFNRATWLTFMKNRLEIAHEFLAEDGSIFVSIDGKQQAYLQVLMNEIFEEKNLLEVFHIQARYTQKSLNEKNDFQPVMEYVLAYAKDKSKFKPNKPFVPYNLKPFKWEIEELSSGEKVTLGGKKVTIFKKGEYRIRELKNGNLDGLKATWASGSVLTGNTSGKFFDQHISLRKEIDGLEVLYKVEGIGDDGIGYRYFTGPKKEDAIRGQFYSGVPTVRREEIEKGVSKKYNPIVNFYDLSGDFGNIRQEGGVPFNSGKKPEKLLKMLIEIATNENDLVLDFHLGSGTTAAVAMKLNRKFIGIEQMDYIEELAVKRLENVIKGDTTGISKEVNWKGGGSFVYLELFEKGLKYIKIVENADDSELVSIYEEIKNLNNIDFNVNLDVFNDSFESLSNKDKRKVLIKILDKNQLYYNFSEINDENIKNNLTDNEYDFNISFYGEEYE